jgi:hypothetical protein
VLADSKLLSFFFLLKEKRNKKVQGKPDRSARFAGQRLPIPKVALLFLVNCLANESVLYTCVFFYHLILV